MFRVINTLVLVFLTLFSFGQSVIDLDWYSLGKEAYPNGSNPEIWCAGCQEQEISPFVVPVYTKHIELSNETIASVEVIPLSTQKIWTKGLNSALSKDFEVTVNHIRVRGKLQATIAVTPMRSNGQSVEFLESFKLNISKERHSATAKPLKKKDQTYISVLNSGTSYKIAISKSGVYRIDREFLEFNGITASNIKLSQFCIYGNGGLMLPEVIAENRAEDLQKNSIYIYDENGNDLLDASDYILWYAQGPDGFKFDYVKGKYVYSHNDYSDAAFYFLKWGEESTSVIPTLTANSGGSYDISLNQYDYLFHHEKDEVNHIHSGRVWWGDEMSFSAPKRQFIYTVPGLVNGADIVLENVTSARSLSTSSVSVKLNTATDLVIHPWVSGVFDGAYTGGYIYNSLSSKVTSSSFTVEFEYLPPLSESRAWIDYFNVFTSRDLKAYEEQQLVSSKAALINGTVRYELQNLNGYVIWDVTDPVHPKIQQTTTSGPTSVFHRVSSTTQLNTFLLFKPASAMTPTFIGKVAQQNLHGIEYSNYLIITHKDFVSQAESLADFHRDRTGMKVDVIRVDQIFNEFSSGGQDVTAIRDFVKLIYDRGMASGKELKYLLMFGDASYDFKDRIDDNTNYVPIYESFNSNYPAKSHCSDDYYAILDDDEGYWGLGPRFEGLDIGLGRLPVSSTYEADLIVTKIKNYHNQSFGDWVNKVTFLADDENYNAHLFCSEHLTGIIANENPNLNINKFYLDAYEQVSFGSGNKYPDVNRDCDRAIQQGTLIFNYVGHGGHSSMAHERVVTRDQMRSWVNPDRLSFFITASCELAAFDNPGQQSPGELMLFNSNGGAVGMIATTRVVYLFTNCDINQAIIQNNLFNLVGNGSNPLGDAYTDMRNRSSFGDHVNKRSFLLLADPAMGLLIPSKKVVTTSINGVPFGQFKDTLSALEKVTITGEVRDENNAIISNFNGNLYPTVYDKFSVIRTRGNDPESMDTTFEVQNNVIYKGKITVTNGQFSFSFVIPKDIAYQFGFGKISYYATDQYDHAGGYEGNIIIGGTADSLSDDQIEPELKLFIDDRSWVFGGTTGYTPLLLADIFDSSGINMVGSGIGREMEAILDEGTDNERLIILNDYFEAELNSYQKGTISYRFTDLEPGWHTVKLKVWDVYNNSTTAYTEFLVIDDSEIAIDHLLNYPNPFTTFTTFHFDHNKAGQNIDVNLTIYTVTGQVVRTFNTTLINASTHSSEISWDGRDEYGDELAAGVYIYTVEIRTEDDSTVKQTQKLYLLN